MYKNNKLNFAFKISLLICVILILAVPTDCQKKKKKKEKKPPKKEEPDNDAVFTTPADGTTKAEEDLTDIPQKDIDDALILDYGRYTTLSFHYEREQWMKSDWVDRCYDDYTKCVTSLIAPTPVCMFYSQWWKSGYKYVNSYCEAYMENCRIGYRYWRIIGNGKCDLGMQWFGTDELIEI